MKTILTYRQRKEFLAHFKYGDQWVTLRATVRHDDTCRNGYNTFSITGEIPELEMGGCLHKEIAEHLPALAPFIKWHLTSTDGPMHYVANTVYHVKERNLDYARSTAVWPEATDDDLLCTEPELTAKLNARLPALMEKFKEAVESLGFTY